MHNIATTNKTTDEKSNCNSKSFYAPSHLRHLATVPFASLANGGNNHNSIYCI